MTDDSNAPYRPSDPFARAPGPGEHSSDPLAELARLIGQSDPFHQPNRDPRPAEPVEHRYDDPAPQQEPSYQEPSYNDRPAPAYDSRYDAPFSHEPAPAPDWHARPAPSYDPFASSAHQAPPYAATDQSYQDPQSQPRASHSDPGYPAAGPHRFDVSSFETAVRHGQGFPASSAMSEAGQMPMPAPHPDEYYDDAPQGGRRKGLFTVAAVLCLAVVGTGAAFGYRTWFGGPSVKAPPPVIRASAEPSKVTPPPQADPKDANKISYDRFGDRGQNEQVVVREEKPVDVRDAARSGPPRPASTGPRVRRMPRLRRPPRPIRRAC